MDMAWALEGVRCGCCPLPQELVHGAEVLRAVRLNE